MVKGWSLQLMGAAQLHSPAVPSAPIALVRKDAAWLAYTALNPGAASLRVATLVWPAVSERAALNSLRQRVYRLRQATGARLVEMADTLVLASDLSLPDRAPVESLAQDPSAWDAALLGDIDFDAEAELASWLASTRKAHAGCRREALARIASEAQHAGELARALRYAKHLLADDPLSEHAHRRLMHLHHQRGDRAAAVAAFEHCEQVLKDELGLRPGTETLALLASVESGHASVALALRPLPATLARPPGLVGREALLLQLALAEQHARLTVVVGEAGMGKSRVLQEHLAGRVDAALAQARPGDAAVPYALLLRLQQVLDAGSGDVCPASSVASSAVMSAVTSAVTSAARSAARSAASSASQSGLPQAALHHRLRTAAAQGLRLVAADDLHFADRASIEALLALSQADDLAGLHWLLAHRPVESADAEAGLLQSLAESPQARRFPLQPLDASQLQALVQSLALPQFDATTLAPALQRHTGGNPLFVMETLRAAWAQTPGSLGLGLGLGLTLPRPQGLAYVIDARLQRLSKPALTLARVAAIAVPDFSLELAEQVLGVSALALADAWQELETAQVLRGEAFAHDLVHDAALRATPDVVARRTHGQVAALLQAAGVAPARVADHWRRAAQPALAAQAWLQAAALAGKAARPREQAQQLLAAEADFVEAGDADGALQAALDAVSPLLTGDGVPAALALTERLLVSGAFDAYAARVWVARADALSWTGRMAEAEAAGRKALALAAPHDEKVRREASILVAQACGLQGRPDEGLALLAPWEEQVLSLPDLHERISFCGGFENLMAQADQPAQALKWGLRHLDWAQQAGDRVEEMLAHVNLSADGMRRGDLTGGIGHAQAAAALATTSEQTRAVASWNNTGLAHMLSGMGRYAEAIDLFERELAYTAGAPTALRANQEQWFAQLWLNLGQPARAQQWLGQDESVPPGYGRAKRLVARAAVELATRGDDFALLQQALQDSAGVPVRRYEWLMAAIGLLRRAEPAQVLAQTKALLPIAHERGWGVQAAQLQALRVTAWLGLHNAIEAGHAARQLEALALRHRHPTAYFPALMQRAAQGHAAAGHHEDARRCTVEALHWVHAVALPQVPPPFVESFLQRNAVNRQLRAEARGLAAD